MLVAASVPASAGNVVAWVCFGLCYSLYLLNKAARLTLYIRVYVFENVLAPGCLLLRLDLFFFFASHPPSLFAFLFSLTRSLAPSLDRASFALTQWFGSGF